MLSFIKQHIYLMLLSLFTIATGLIHFFFEIRFQGSDDVLMTLISSGAYSGTVDSHLVFINIVYATVLNVFYSTIPNVEWYAIFFLLINIISTATIAKVIIEYTAHFILKVALFLFLMSVFLQISTDLQFTKTAGLAATASLLLILNKNIKTQFFGVALFVLAALIRFDAAFLALLISAPIFLVGFLKVKKEGLSLENKMIFVAVGFSLFFKVADYAYYNSNADWKYYKEYDKYRGAINDNPNSYPLLDKELKNLSKVDYKAFLYFFPNPSVINVTTVKNIYDQIDQIPLRDRMHHVKQLDVYYAWIACLIFIVIAYLLFTKGLLKKSMIFAILLLLIGVLMYVSLASTVKYRVFFICLIAFVFLLPIVFKNQSLKIGGTIFVSFLIFFLTFNLNERFSELAKSRKIDALHLTASNLLITEYLSNDSKKIVPFFMEYPLASQSAFHISSKFPANKMFFSGWLSHVPFNKGKFDSFKCFTEGYGLLSSTKHAALVTNFVIKSVAINSGIALISHIAMQSDGFVVIEFSEK